MKNLFLSLLLTLLAFSAYSQKSSAAKPAGPLPLAVRAGKPLTLAWPQVVQLVHYTDSLKVVARSARQQARTSALAADAYRASADSLLSAVRAGQYEVGHLKEALARTNVLLVSQSAKTAKYKARAHRKGWLLAVVGIVGAGLVVGAVAH